MNKDKINNIFSIFHKNSPAPQTELNYTNNYTMLVAVILSAQSTDAQVNKATKSLFEKISSPEDVIAMGHDSLLKHVKSIGLFNSKAKNILKMSKMLIEDYNSTVPSDFKDLIKLAGVGRKTANVVLNCAFGVPTIAVDTHVFRVARRIGFASGSSAEIVEKELMKKIPMKWIKAGAHHWLILHGRYTCTARAPKCNICPISKFCKSFKNFNEP